MNNPIGMIVILISLTVMLAGCANTESKIDALADIQSCTSFGVRQPTHSCQGANQDREQIITVSLSSISVEHEPLASCPGDTLVFTADPITTEFAILFNPSKWPGNPSGPNDIWATNGVLNIKVINSHFKDCVGYSVVVKDTASKTVRGLDPVLIIDY